jgi:hypothetical protein
MTRRAFAVSLVLVLAVLAAAPASARPKQLGNAAAVLAALKSGTPVRAVFHYKDMKLTDDEGKEATAPDATGGMSLDAWEYFAAGVVGNPVGYVATSEAHLIRHPRHGYVLNYVKVSIYDDGKVKIVAQYVEPKTYEVKMNETFETQIADGKNNAGAFFFTGD